MPQNRNTYRNKYNTWYGHNILYKLQDIKIDTNKSSSCSLSLRWVAPDDIPYEPQDTSVFLHHGRDHDQKSEDIDKPDVLGVSTTSERKQGSSLPRISESEASGEIHLDQVCHRLTLKWEPILNITHRYFACRCLIRRSSPSQFEPEIDILRFARCPRHNNKGVSFRDYQDYEDPQDDLYFDKFGGYDAFRAFIHCYLTPLYISLGSERFLAQGDVHNAYAALQTAREVLGEGLMKVHQDYIFEHDDMLLRLGFTASDNARAYITAERKRRGLDQACGIANDQIWDLEESPMEKEVKTILNGEWRGKRHWLPDC
ncbi:hypothetical protein DPV78_003593 [Talaromyces pinophilus]|nr:hypothetical protein DPV78_003593 [Talaromyces pinophilus]